MLGVLHSPTTQVEQGPQDTGRHHRLDTGSGSHALKGHLPTAAGGTLQSPQLFMGVGQSLLGPLAAVSSFLWFRKNQNPLEKTQRHTAVIAAMGRPR